MPISRQAIAASCGCELSSLIATASSHNPAMKSKQFTVRTRAWPRARLLPSGCRPVKRVSLSQNQLVFVVAVPKFIVAVICCLVRVDLLRNPHANLRPLCVVCCRKSARKYVSLHGCPRRTLDVCVSVLIPPTKSVNKCVTIAWSLPLYSVNQCSHHAVRRAAQTTQSWLRVMNCCLYVLVAPAD